MRTLNLGKPLIHLSETDSTNSYAATLLQKNNATEGTVILADYQTKGKGQSGNQWTSDANINLLFSIIIKPEFLPVEKQYYLSMCISNGLVECITTLGLTPMIKWPNDILLNRKKVAGVLIENTLSGNMLQTSVIGIGINVNQQVFPIHLPNPTSLCLESCKKFNLHHILDALLKSLTGSINLLYNNRLGTIRTDYLNNLWGLNKWAFFSDLTETFEGRIIDVADTGELIVMCRDGRIKSFAFKEIRFTEI